MTLNNTVEWFEQAVPAPDNKTLSVQLGCHIEEFCELLETFHLSDAADGAVDVAFHNLRIAADALKSGEAHITGIDKLPMLDALADGIVTATGMAHMAGMDIVGALGEVNRSNWSKFEDGKPVFNENGKIAKGKDYSKPELKPYLHKKKDVFVGVAGAAEIEQATLRDQFAMAAMQALVTNDLMIRRLDNHPAYKGIKSADAIACEAYIIADATLSERNKEPQP